VCVDDLRADPRNARKHGRRNIKALKSSLLRFGQVEPLIVQERTMQLIAGHGRLQAMKELGFSHARCVVLDVSDKRARSLGVALNRTAELAEWDFDVLASLLQEAPDDGLGLEDLGFVQEELDAMLLTVEDLTGDKPQKVKTTVTLKVVCAPGDAGEVQEAIERALEEAGLEAEVKS